MSDAIGELRARVRLQRPVRSEDDLGGAPLDWSDAGDVWAHVVALGAGQGAAFDAAPAVTSLRVTINRREDVRAGWRAVWGARIMRIVGVRDEGGSRIELSAEEEML